MPWMTVDLPDGRVLDVLTGEARSGAGLLFHHGTPGNAPRYRSWFAAAEARGLRPVGYSRPGYATSTRHPGRTVASVAADVTELLDQLGIDEFYTVGGSGGGPHAIACAALFADRCLASAALVTIAPWGAPGLDYMADMAQLNIDEFNAALAGEAALREYLAREGEQFRHVTGADIVAALGDALPAADLLVANVDLPVVEALLARLPADRAISSGYLDHETPRVQGWEPLVHLEVDGWAADLLAVS